MTRSTCTYAISFVSLLAIASAQSNTAGCGKDQNFLGLTKNRTIQSANLTRQYSVHLPINYNKNSPAPVIFAFHGSGETSLELEIDTRLSLTNFTNGKIVIYPDGIGETWAGAGYSNATVDQDVSFVTDMIDDLSANFCIDTSRIYATGFSNGGGFVNVLACSEVASSKIAAFAPVGGAYYGYDLPPYNQTCAPARVPLPILEIHGGSDQTVFYAGGKGEGGTLPPITNWLDWWAAQNNCTNKTETDTFNNTVHHIQWTCNGIDGALQHYKVDPLKHDWPSTLPNFSQLASGDTPAKIEANDIIVAFFNQYTLTTPSGIVANETSIASVNGTSTKPSGTGTTSGSMPTSTGEGGSAASSVRLGVAGYTGLIFGLLLAVW